MERIERNEKLLKNVSRKCFLLWRDLRDSFSSINPFLNILRGKPISNRDKSKYKKERFPSITVKLNPISRENLLSFSLLISILGTLALFILSFLISPKFVALNDLNSIADGAFIETTGFIFEIKVNQFKICDSFSSNFCYTALLSQGRIPAHLIEGDHIYVKGIVRSFNNKKFISIQDSSALGIVNDSSHMQ